MVIWREVPYARPHMHVLLLMEGNDMSGGRCLLWHCLLGVWPGTWVRVSCKKGERGTKCKYSRKSFHGRCYI